MDVCKNAVQAEKGSSYRNSSKPVLLKTIQESLGLNFSLSEEVKSVSLSMMSCLSKLPKKTLQELMRVIFPLFLLSALWK